MRRLALFCLLSLAVSAQTYRGQIGVQIEDAQEGSRSKAFVDLGRVFRPWTTAAGPGPVALDANGWPLVDASTVIFDIRPIPAWAPPIDDPDRFQPDWSGTYHLSFEGQAIVDPGDANIKLVNQQWNSATNTTTADLQVPPGTGLLVLTFRDSKRTPSSPINTGIANLHVIRPGYPAGSTQVFTDEFLDALAPFSVLRFMGFTSTNDADAKKYPATLEWADRHRITDATQQSTGGRIGFAWEYVALLANETGKDIWINIPVSASEDYIRQLARLLRDRLNPQIKVYVEHSNEVWNQIFPQYAWNTAAAGSDGVTNLQRHARRLVVISDVFREVFGDDAMMARIRPVFAWWTLRPDDYDAAMGWVGTHYGPPAQRFYAIAQTHYFNDESAPSSSDVSTVLTYMRGSTDGGVSMTKRLIAVARKYNLKPVVYEGGPDIGGGRTANIANRIRANRDERMKDLVIHDIKDNWFDQGGDLYMYFTLSGPVSRYGAWGAVEDIMHLDTPKYNALLELIGPAPQPPAIDKIANAASTAAEIAPGGIFSIYGSNFTHIESTWNNAIYDGKTLPPALNGVRVRVNGRDAFIAYAGPGQVNAVAPSDLSEGSAAVEVITNSGRVSKSVDIVRTSPAFYGFSRNETKYAWAVVATAPGPVYIASVGAFGPGYQSRPAKPGDILSLFVNGLGGLGPDFVNGQVMTAPYTIDKSTLSVTIDGVAAPVAYAGLISPGLYQLNITVPQLSLAGDVPIVLTSGDKITEPGIMLTVEP